MKTIFYLLAFSFSFSSFAQSTNYATRVTCEVQSSYPELRDLVWLQGTTPAVQAVPMNAGKPLAYDASTSVRMIIGPTAIGTNFAVRTNAASVTNSYAIQWPTIGTNTGTNAWFYTLLFDRAGQTYWSGSGRLYIDATTSTASNGLEWIEYTTPNVGWANVVGDPADNAALVQYVEDHGGGSAEDTVARAAVAAVSGRVDTVEGWGDHGEAGYLTAEADAAALGAIGSATNALLDLAGTRAMTGDVVTLARDVMSRDAANVGIKAVAFGENTSAGNYGAAFGFSTIAESGAASFGKSTIAKAYGAAFGERTEAGEYAATFGQYSKAGSFGISAGFKALNTNVGSFVFADSQSADFNRGVYSNSFSVRASGGTYFETPTFEITGAIKLGTNAAISDWPAEGGTGTGSGWTNLSITGTGNAITGATAAGTTLTLERGTIEGGGTGGTSTNDVRSIRDEAFRTYTTLSLIGGTALVTRTSGRWLMIEADAGEVTLDVDAASYTNALEGIQHNVMWIRGTNETYAIVTNNIDNTLFVDLPASTTNHLFIERRPGWPRFQIWQDFR